LAYTLICKARLERPGAHQRAGIRVDDPEKGRLVALQDMRLQVVAELELGRQREQQRHERGVEIRYAHFGKRPEHLERQRRLASQPLADEQSPHALHRRRNGGGRLQACAQRRPGPIENVRPAGTGCEQWAVHLPDHVPG
jgi:hypothetical protein